MAYANVVHKIINGAASKAKRAGKRIQRPCSEIYVDTLYSRILSVQCWDVTVVYWLLASLELTTLLRFYDFYLKLSFCE
ncbi:hypothetical protein GCM10009092_01110 [Bowmanella denitrificans]|uniref:Uncharacterized protein n=1 Tax=Bowmanella denitrificans TaxID=366582 RepID=A0ABN0WKX7_9ALTE